jgi:hypothetical protein
MPKPPRLGQESQTKRLEADSTIDSEDFQMLMMLKQKLKKVRKKEENQKL